MLTIYASPSPTMTVDALRLLVRDLGIYGLSAGFSGLPETITVTADGRDMHEAVRILNDADTTLADARCDGHRSFRDYFGDKMPLDEERMTVYMDMCKEDRI